VRRPLLTAASDGAKGDIRGTSSHVRFTPQEVVSRGELAIDPVLIASKIVFPLTYGKIDFTILTMHVLFFQILF